MVLASLVHYGERIKAGVDVVGIANFRTFLERTSGYRVDLRRVEYGDERDPAMQAVFDRISPANHAGRIRSALLVAHGRNDPRVPFAEAEQIAEKVRAQGRPVWTVYAANEGHGFARKENRDHFSAVAVLFLRRHLLD
jgi:dipeptidyl aminopeptidase/acylaminoacyl peptidase